MASEQEKQIVRQQIEAFFKLAGITPHGDWSGEVNEGVAAVFGKMLEQTRRCSRAMAWVPRPPSGPATIKWLATQLGGAALRSIRSGLSVVCARQAVANFADDFWMASKGLSVWRTKQWGCA